VQSTVVIDLALQLLTRHPGFFALHFSRRYLTLAQGIEHARQLTP
jgi:hypothetical protein